MSRPLVLLVSLLLAAVGGEAFAARYVYLHDSTAQSIHAFTMDPATGGLTPLAGSPFESDLEGLGWEGLCHTIAFAPARNALVTAGQDGLDVWLMASDGTLTLHDDAPFGDTDGGFLSVAAVRIGKRTYVYASEPKRSRVHAFEMLGDGTLEDLPGSPVASGGMPAAMLVHGKRLMVANRHDAVTTYALSKKGFPQIAAGTPRALESEDAYTLAQDAKGKFVYLPDPGDAQVLGFKIDGKGRLKKIGGAPFELDIAADRGLAFGWQGYGVGFAHSDDPGVMDAQVVRIDLKKGRMETLGGAQSTGLLVDVEAHAIDPSGLRVVAATTTGVHVFSIDPTTGVLAAIDGEEIAADHVTGIVFVDR